MADAREPSYSVRPRVQYNTVNGVSGPLVIVENVSVTGLFRRLR